MLSNTQHNYVSTLTHSGGVQEDIWAGPDFEALLLLQNALRLFTYAYLSCTIKVIFQNYLKAREEKTLKLP